MAAVVDAVGNLSVQVNDVLDGLVVALDDLNTVLRQLPDAVLRYYIFRQLSEQAQIPHDAGIFVLLHAPADIHLRRGMFVFKESLRHADEIGHLGDDGIGAVAEILHILLCGGRLRRRCRLVDNISFFAGYFVSPSCAIQAESVQ